jgi:hypothetical protein
MQTQPRMQEKLHIPTRFSYPIPTPHTPDTPHTLNFFAKAIPARPYIPKKPRFLCAAGACGSSGRIAGGGGISLIRSGSRAFRRASA